MARTYIPTLVRLMRRAAVYITAHQDTLNENLDTSQQEALSDLNTAVNAFLALVTIEILP